MTVDVFVSPGHYLILKFSPSKTQNPAMFYLYNFCLLPQLLMVVRNEPFLPAIKTIIHSTNKNREITIPSNLHLLCPLCRHHPLH